MSGIYIKGMEMPKEPDEMIEIAIFGDGNVIQTGESWRSPENGKCYYTTTTPEKFFNAVPVQPHGRLIDADAAVKQGWTISRTYSASPNQMVYEVKAMTDEILPTIIPASEEEMK